MSGKSYTYSQVVATVLKFGSDKWDLIGLKLGYTDGEINSATVGKPTDAGKLQAIINLKTSEVGEKELAKLLLEACANLPQPIIGHVQQYLDPTYDPKAGVVTIEGSASGIQKPGAASLVQPATRTSDADQMVEKEEIVSIAEAIEGFWDTFAVQLDPNLFDITGKIEAIQRNQNYASPRIKAQVMLETWRNNKDKDATRRLLIETFCKMGKVKQANEVFRESLTDFVRQHKTNVIDGPLPPDKQTVVARQDPGNRTASDKAEATPTVAGDQIDALIVTSTDIEYKAIIEFLQNVSAPMQLKNNPLFYSGHPKVGCQVATWNPGNDRSPMMVGVVQQTEQGQDGANKIVAAIKESVEKKRIAKSGLVAMIGMCAGNESLVKLGDVLVPWEISPRKRGGRQTGSSYEQKAKLASTPDRLRSAVQMAAQSTGQGNNTWLDTVPDKFKGGVPSPRYLYDVTLLELQNTSKCSIGELHEHIMKQYKWPELINRKILKEAIEHSKSLGYIEVDTSQPKEQFSVHSEGRCYLEKMSDEDEFPRADHDPEIRCNAFVVMGDYVDKALTNDKAWNDLAHDAGLVKVHGYEMEGYAFLNGMQDEGCETLTPLFIKTVADLGTKEYKMKDRYYQEYATAVAAAFLFRFLTDCPPEFWQPKTAA